MRLFLVAQIFVIVLVVASCDNDVKKEKTGEAAVVTTYTCPMHPQVVEDHPGTCPICKMDLVPVKQQSGSAELVLNDDQIRLANIKTVKAGAGEFNSNKVVNARVLSDALATEVISSRFPGRIDVLFVRETGATVSPGQPLFRIYSEQLQTLQEDYLLQIRQAEAFPEEKIYRDLLTAATRKLRLFGYSAQQIQQLRKRAKPDPLITVQALRGGVVKELNVQQGQYISEGMPLMRLENYGSVWVEADVYPGEAAGVRVGTPMTVIVPGLGEQVTRVDFVAPQLNPETQILTIRATLRNAGMLLQPGMGVQAILGERRGSQAIKVPIDGVIREEKGAYVWVAKENHKFAMRRVETGPEDERFIVVTKGLLAGEDIVVSGAYLLYSEHVLKKGSG